MVDRLALENARQQALTIRKESSLVKAAVDQAKCKIVYAMYDMQAGAVTFYDVAPGAPPATVEPDMRVGSGASLTANPPGRSSS